MSIVRSAFGLEKRDAFPPLQYPYSDGGKWNQGMVWQPYGGTNVTTDSSMRVAAVFACLRLLSEAIATLPLDTFVNQGDVRRPFPIPDYLLFKGEGEDRINYISQVMLSLLTDGNAYVATPRRMGVPLSLTVLDPCKVKKYRVRKGEPNAGRIRFELNAGQYGTQDDLTVFDILHIPGMMLPGSLTGLSPIGYARDVIGSALSAQQFGQAFFDNSAQPAANLEFPEPKTKDQAVEIYQAWKETHGGTSGAGSIGVLSGGAKMVSTQINQRDAQFIELRQFQVPDIARIYGVPPHLIADASNSTSWGSGLAEQNLAFGQFSLRPWVTRFEAGHTWLMQSHQPGAQYSRLNMDALLRASLKDRYEAYAVGIGNEFLEVDEARATEDMAPSPDRIRKADAEKLLLMLSAGFDAEDTMRVLGLPTVKHTGTVPVHASTNPPTAPEAKT